MPEQMPQHHSLLRQLSPEQLKLAILKTAAYAARKLGNRIGASPAMDPRVLTSQAIADTIEGIRNWNSAQNSLEQHLAGCINSYISHYFKSREAQTPTVHWHGPDSENYILSQRTWDHRTPDSDLINRQMMEGVRKKVESDGDPDLLRVWQRVEDSKWDLYEDRTRFCLDLGLDPETGGAGYQKFYRLRKKIQNYTEQYLAEDHVSHTPGTH